MSFNSEPFSSIYACSGCSTRQTRPSSRSIDDNFRLERMLGTENSERAIALDRTNRDSGMSDCSCGNRGTPECRVQVKSRNAYRGWIDLCTQYYVIEKNPCLRD